MKRIIIIFLFITSTLSVSCQNSGHIFYGICETNIQLRVGDIIKMNLPSHTDGRFIKNEDFPELLQFRNFLEEHNNFFFQIEVHYNEGAREFNRSYTKSLCENLNGYLLNESSKKINFEIKQVNIEGEPSRLEIKIQEGKENNK